MSECGLSKFYALEILEEVIPDAEYICTEISRNWFECVFKWRTFEVTATGEICFSGKIYLGMYL